MTNNATVVDHAAEITFANRVEVVRSTDHFIVRLGFQAKPNDQTFGREVAKIALPLTTSVDVCLKLFEGMLLAIPDLQRYFEQVGGRVAALNMVKEQAEKSMKQGEK